MKKLFLLPLFILIISCNNPPLKFIGEAEFLSGTNFKTTDLGGLSGLFMDSNGRLVALSDDRGKYDHPRLFKLKASFENGLKIVPEEITYLKNVGGRHFENNKLDPEDIIILKDKSYFIVSEQNLKGEVLKPEIIKFTPEGVLVEILDIPNDFMVKEKKGIRNNKGFESLAISSDEKYLYTANEDALLQDGEMATLHSKSNLRLLRYKKKGSSYEFDRYYHYELSKIKNEMHLKESKYADNGLVALVSISDNTLYSLERSFVLETKKNTIKIFKVTLDGKKNIATKKLILDLDDILPKLKLGVKRLDNMEGMCLGPKLKNGNDTLILVSDNNFSDRQRTLFLAFEIQKK